MYNLFSTAIFTFAQCKIIWYGLCGVDDGALGDELFPCDERVVVVYDK